MEKEILTIDESRIIMLNILLKFDSFCEKHHLHYSLSEGTLLGAVRHKGFIPWDDDIDVLMPREDYNTLLSIWYDDEYYKLINAYNCSIWPSPLYMRITDNRTGIEGEFAASYYPGGLWIDIFPLDNCPEDEYSFKKYERNINFYLKLYKGKIRKEWYHDVSILLNLRWLLFKTLVLPVPSTFLRKLIEKTAQKYYNIKTKKAGWYGPLSKRFISFPSSYFCEYTKLQFEGHFFSVFTQYDNLLKEEYGDYMQLPPIEKRKPKHMGVEGVFYKIKS